ncbi:MAG: DUF4157 domain-containing protein [Deltaproteobacteria bacterium]|nr:DUF4157 domain-containing protein [Deltaproteobacteria bacterium]
MANQDDNTSDLEPGNLTDELAKKYDPDRLLKAFAKKAGKSEALDHSVRNKYERRFGVDLGHVRVITGEFAEEFNKKRDAYAVTVGSTGMILMGGSPDRTGRAGQALLAHELTHVAQARRGLHRSSSYAGAMQFTEEHEHEAEAVEREEGGGGGGGGESPGTAKNRSADAKKERDEKIKERVLELAADAFRVQKERNGRSRRP